MSERPLDIGRPYLVVPKLVEQSTWGGDYIAAMKQWGDHEQLAGRRLGQSYELFSGSNLSLADSSLNPDFQGELTDRDAVERLTAPLGTVSLANLIKTDPEAVLGREMAARTAGVLNVLIKLTQAMGNSFQIHIKDGTTHPFWRPKPESWYYLEPGLMTLGVRPDVDWQAYQAALTALDDQITVLQDHVRAGDMTYDDAQIKIDELVKKYNPWAYVNTVEVSRDQLVDLSGGGLHHSWEEDAARLPHGNVLYELQLEAMDHNSTIRGFDKGKMARDGSVRKLNVRDYFALIDRTPEVNDPASHMGTSEILSSTEAHVLEKLLGTPYYSLHKLTLLQPGSTYNESTTEYRHVFVKEGAVEVSTAAGMVVLTRGHSCFVPASAHEYSVVSASGPSEVLITT
ncbi:MAG TPA: hypothetical protein VM124_03545 [Candidatus Limnocylindrales bacterium]|nr:hypothetical protein [Candidatus Limnocylindrales bacterium]